MRSLKIPSLASKSKKRYDADTIILHACFQVLKDCVEEEKIDTRADYETFKEFVASVARRPS